MINFCGCQGTMAAKGLLPGIIPPECREYPVWFDWSGYDEKAMGLPWTVFQSAAASALNDWSSWLDVHFYLHKSKAHALCHVSFVPSDQLSPDVVKHPVWVTSNSADGTCRVKKQAYANDRDWNNRQRVQAGVAHEFGHIVGIRHMSGDSIMSGLREDLVTVQVKDVEAASALGYIVRMPNQDEGLTVEEKAARYDEITKIVEG